MNMGIKIGIGGQRNQSPLSAVSSFLAVNGGAFWRLSDTSTAFESADTSDPAEIGDGIQLLKQSLPSGGSHDWAQSTLASRPTLQAGYASLDGGDFWNGANAVLTATQNKGAICFGFRGQIDSLASDRVVIAFSVGTVATTPRLGVNVLSTGAVNIPIRRLDADGAFSVSSSAGAVAAGVPFSLLVTINFAAGGTGAVRGYIDNGVDILNGTLAGTGATSDTPSLAARWGQNLAGAATMTGRITSGIISGGIPDANTRTQIFNALAT
jgi:hypothetical protein